MRILHTADLHLGKTLNNYSLLKSQYEFKDRLLEIIEKEKIDIVLISGDVFDTSISTAGAIDLYSELVTEISKRSKIIIISGNHDSSSRLAQLNGVLKRVGVYIVTGLDDSVKPIIIEKDSEKIQFFALSYFNIENVKIRYKENIENYMDAYKVLTAEMKKSFDKNIKQILLAHAFVTGSKTSDSDCLTKVGTSEEVGVDVFKDFYYVALGHLHSSQNHGKNVRYSGSPLKYSFAEANQKKSVTIIDTLTDEIKETEIVVNDDLLVLEGKYLELLEKAKELEGSTSYVKLIITDKNSSFSVFDVFKEYFPNLCAIETNRGVDVITEKAKIKDVNSLPVYDVVKNFYDEIIKEEFSKEKEELLKKAITLSEKER